MHKPVISAWLDLTLRNLTLLAASAWCGSYSQTLRPEASVPKSQEVYLRSLHMSYFSQEMVMPETHHNLDRLFFCFLINSLGKKQLYFCKTCHKCCKSSFAPLWQRRTLLEPCNLTCVEGAIQSSKLLYVLLSSWWNLDNILCKTKESTVFLCVVEKQPRVLSPSITVMLFSSGAAELCPVCTAPKGYRISPYYSPLRIGT